MHMITYGNTNLSLLLWKEQIRSNSLKPNIFYIYLYLGQKFLGYWTREYGLMTQNNATDKGQTTDIIKQTETTEPWYLQV